jgi:predicted ATPase
MEKIIIQNFGPIDEAEIIVKDINLLIGPNSSGKSTTAKLISIFNGSAIKSNPNYRGFINLLVDHNIEFNIKDNTLIRYDNNELYFEIKGESFRTNLSIMKEQKVSNSIFIPAERMFFPIFSESIFRLINNDIILPKWLIHFGAKFEQARNSIKKFPIDFLNAIYEFDGSTDYIKLAGNDKIKLSQASSGLQSVIPLILVVHFNTEPDKENENIFIIEEPELNLSPSSQKGLIEYIISRMNLSNDKIVISTHSPCLLTAIDNLIQANNVAESTSGINVFDKIEDLVPMPGWVDFKKVSCYFFKDMNANPL